MRGQAYDDELIEAIPYRHLRSIGPSVLWTELSLTRI